MSGLGVGEGSGRGDLLRDDGVIVWVICGGLMGDMDFGDWCLCRWDRCWGGGGFLGVVGWYDD